MFVLLALSITCYYFVAIIVPYFDLFYFILFCPILLYSVPYYFILGYEARHDLEDRLHTKVDLKSPRKSFEPSAKSDLSQLEYPVAVLFKPERYVVYDHIDHIVYVIGTSASLDTNIQLVNELRESIQIWNRSDDTGKIIWMFDSPSVDSSLKIHLFKF